ncbi:MAG: hypothetical protein IPO15_16130 [Anaerolineae bacterium]|uniref:hypothetical protein n=1 Tax=Candidatus Amarolinea dominans TaxID=3140696 RepID=UPI003136DA67|nr:hypothetical protein [Anaerolineae bacterium]
MSWRRHDPACDANQDGVITVNDIQLTAGHWNQTGTFVSDSNHTHLGQTWTERNNPIKIQGSIWRSGFAPLVLKQQYRYGLAYHLGCEQWRAGGLGGDAGVQVSPAGINGVAV